MCNLCTTKRQYLSNYSIFQPWNNTGDYSLVSPPLSKCKHLKFILAVQKTISLFFCFLYFLLLFSQCPRYFQQFYVLCVVFVVLWFYQTKIIKMNNSNFQNDSIFTNITENLSKENSTSIENHFNFGNFILSPFGFLLIIIIFLLFAHCAASIEKAHKDQKFMKKCINKYSNQI